MLVDNLTTTARAVSVQSPARSTPRARDGYFQCGFCKKHYNRADHLIRHVRSHTREKPYVCHVCSKGFARPDLMKRHAAGHDHPRDGKRKRPPVFAKSGRVSQACRACATSKLKCDEEKPCRRCRDKKLDCDWQETNPGEMSPGSSSQAYDEPDENELYLQAPQTQGVFPSPAPIMNELPPPIDPAAHFATPDFPVNNFLPQAPESAPLEDPLTTSYDAISPSLDHESGIFSIDGTFFPEFIPDSLITSLSRPDLDPSLNHTQEYAYGVFDQNIPFTFDLTEIDFGLIEYFNSQGITNHAPPTIPEAPNDRADVDNGIALGAEAYKRSSLSAWKPAQSDNAFAHQNDLAVPGTIDSPSASPRSEHKILSERLSAGSRDLMFGMVLQASQKANPLRIMKSFPSTELLDGLIQDYFAYQSRQVDSFIHGPTFWINEQSSDTLTSIAAAAATRSTIPTIRKLGYALLEIVRLQISDKYETDNRTTRDLRASQTFALVLDIGLWSGNGRRTEIAESFQQPLLTMLRRALRLRRSVYTVIVPTISDTQEELEQKWRDWAELESFKRLVHHLFLHDAQASLMLNVNPLISYAELELPLPSIRSLWEAKSSTEWRDVYLASGLTGRERLPSLVDAMRDMSRVQTHVDSQLAGFVVVHGLAAMVSEYHRFSFISKGSSKHWNGLVISSRHQELSQALQHFRMVCYEWPEFPGPEVFLVHEVVSMFLYMSLEELQLFAGKEDKREARRVYHSALEWIESSDSRRAVWHAGQVVRAAKAMPPGSLTGFLAVGVYYASLAFWSYSVVAKAKSAKSTGQAGGGSRSSPGLNARNSQSPPITYLDGEETTEVQKFISLGCGSPALQGPDGPAFVSDPRQTMAVAQGLLRADASQESLPPLVQGLCQLMGDLGKAAKSSSS
ncbi:putative C6 and C2H2 transcription factor RegA-like [Aspergillus saccharolyticus JOP 1030-1]|uniref:C2H2 type zinc finger domain protein n=1 Tax=Aspergillus saccharolyticus JOP 1030-1 TaxID=1450539 RepID=A0A319ABA6_9EURO|nr:C2H2 type zinc finger domain protein [Aspergillus saccharolyticus JOP 1030-1]PYH48928.1 C2H2 type zinc finger domain protein [Aspergillus saccharolyticus JOP 1030-1]